jgi:hypothetical protein
MKDEAVAMEPANAPVNEVYESGWLGGFVVVITCTRLYMK